jgi:hypothetical protein
MSLAGYRTQGQPQQKIHPEHLDRAAVVYVRQSTRHQVLEHTESTRLHYALAERAVALGWARSQITVIDDDLGMSAATADSGRALPGSSRRSRWDVQASAWGSRCPGWRGPAGTGPSSWSRAACQGCCSPIPTASTTPDITTTGCCWA